jgi:hypothetical protein
VTGRSLGPAFAQRIEDDFPVGAFGLGGENKTLPHPYTENPVQGSKVTDFFFNHCRAQLWLLATIFFVHFFCVQSIWALLVMTTVQNPEFVWSLTHHDRKPSAVPSLVESDASHSSSTDWEIPSMPELLQVPPPSSQPTIEISPGVHVRLRGASETWEAIENDYYMPAECICCESTIFCIQNAVFVLCPDCRVVSRMEGVSSRGMGGVGLGFKYEDLARWQDAILTEQLNRHPQAQF